MLNNCLYFLNCPPHYSSTHGINIYWMPHCMSEEAFTVQQEIQHRTEQANHKPLFSQRASSPWERHKTNKSVKEIHYFRQCQVLWRKIKQEEGVWKKRWWCSTGGWGRPPWGSASPAKTRMRCRASTQVSGEYEILNGHAWGVRGWSGALKGWWGNGRSGEDGVRAGKGGQTTEATGKALNCILNETKSKLRILNQGLTLLGT